jgi:hypothetical protein
MWRESRGHFCSNDEELFIMLSVLPPGEGGGRHQLYIIANYLRIPVFMRVLFTDGHNGLSQRPGFIERILTLRKQIKTETVILIGRNERCPSHAVFDPPYDHFPTKGLKRLS